MELNNFKGVIAAVLTPTINLREKMAETADFLLKRGVEGMFVLGTMGEGAKLGREKRAEVAEAAVETAGSKMLVIVHVGASDLDTVLWLTRHASRIGAHAVSAVAPFYYRYDTESLIKFYQKISDESSVPVLVYNNPGRQGYPIPAESLAKILETVYPPPGLKESSGDTDLLLQLFQKFGKERFLAAGGDHIMAYSFIMGYRRHVSAIASLYPEIASGMYRNVLNGNIEEALRLQQIFNKVRDAVKKVGPDTAAPRYVLKLRGLDVGEPIPPTRPLSPQETETLAKLLPTEQQIT
ncbi:MAG: dihydrodipicolinate synthase family protein [Candidatus Caldarchaeum sp.]|nr:dihydrodipicolinate synthase family protein [Candidatus Caldarchaeum sp.]MCX8200641.1 dihydrodipicolinate synthase family protein [Candidatus Caldarchaeum sp.]MDW8434584.1 dihydrodipicolinate synthase family protein [Candidatus Caldarchaeum sp.]